MLFICLGIWPTFAAASLTAADYVHLGNVSGKADKNTQAIDYYTKAIKLDPNNLKAFYNRGYAYVKIRKYKLAIKDLNRAIEINPAYAPSFHVRGIAYFMRKKYNDAVVDYDKAIELDPYNIMFLISRMSANLKLGYEDRVWKDVMRIQKLGGTVNPTIINLLKNKKYRT